MAFNFPTWVKYVLFTNVLYLPGIFSNNMAVHLPCLFQQPFLFQAGLQQ